METPVKTDSIDKHGTLWNRQIVLFLTERGSLMKLSQVRRQYVGPPMRHCTTPPNRGGSVWTCPPRAGPLAKLHHHTAAVAQNVGLIRVWGFNPEITAAI